MPYENSEHSPIRLGRRPETDRNDHYGAQQAGTRQPHKQYLSAVTWTVAAACLCPAGARQDAHRSTRTRGVCPAGHRVLAQPRFVRRKKFRLPKHVRKARVLLSGLALAEHPMAPPGGHGSLPNADSVSGNLRRCGTRHCTQNAQFRFVVPSGRALRPIGGYARSGPHRSMTWSVTAIAFLMRRRAPNRRATANFTLRTSCLRREAD